MVKKVFRKRFFLLGISLSIFFVFSSVFAANPVALLNPNSNILDPGSPNTPWGGCGPFDANCYFVKKVTETKTKQDITRVIDTPPVQTKETISNQSLISALRNLLSSNNLPNDILKKLKGPQGIQGPKGDAGISTVINQSSNPLPSTYLPGAIIQPNYSTGYSGGSILGVTDLSSGNFITTNAKITTLNVSGNSDMTGNLNVGGTLGVAGQFISSLATGTAPFAVTSTTLNTNLNSDLLDGQHGSYYAPLINITGTINYISKFTGINSVGNSLVYDNGTNVGIGTTNPLNKLNIVSDGNATSGAQLMLQGLTNQNNKMFIGFDTTLNYGYIQTVGDRSSKSLVLNQDGGNVGIGTTTPGARLEIYEGDLLIRRGNRTAAILLSDGTNQNTIKTDVSNHALTFGIAGVEKMQISSSGNVGIGTTSPENKFVVGLGSANGQSIALQDSSNTKILTGTGLRSDTSYDSNFDALGGVRINLDVDNNSTNDFRIIDGTDNIRFLIQESGNVGIGTTAPSQMLHILNTNGTAKVRIESKQVAGINEVLQLVSSVNYLADRGVKLGLYVGNGSDSNRLGAEISAANESTTATYMTFNTESNSAVAERMRITGAGNVGIGTTSPGHKLQIGAMETLVGTLGVQSDSNHRAINIEENSGGETWQLGVIANGDLFFEDSGTGAKVTFQDGGNVGIGTTSPGTKLVISNSGYFQWFMDNRVTPPVGSRNWGFATNYNNEGDFAILRSSTSTGNPDIANSAVTINNLGNVGIGTTSPVTQFTVSGTGRTIGGTASVIMARIENSVAAANGVASGLEFANGYNANGTNYIKSISQADYSGYLTFGGYNGTTWVENMRIDSKTGNVGIGTTAPSEILDIRQANVGGDTSLLISNQAEAGTTAESVEIKFSLSNNSNHLTRIAKIVAKREGTFGSAGASDSSLRFYNVVAGTPTEQLTIQTNGNVGIGTTSPGLALEVSNAGGVSTAGQIRARSTESSTYADFGISRTAANYGLGLWLGGNQQANFYGAGLSLGTYTNVNPPANGMIISGNVGIGMTSPNHKLDIQGIVTSRDSTTSGIFLSPNVSGVNVIDSSFVSGGTSYPLAFSIGASEKMRITTAGNVGIGTTNPGTRLDVAGTINVGGSITLANSSYKIYATTLADVSSVDYSKIVHGGSSKTITFNTDAVDRMIINNTGNVGIGTTAPLASLHVKGAQIILQNDSAEIEYKNTAGVNKWSTYLSGNDLNIFEYNSLDLTRMTFKSGGNVGIGTTAPSYKLHVVNSGAVGLTIEDTSAGGSDIDINLNHTVGTAADFLIRNDITGGLRFREVGVADRFRIGIGGLIGLGGSITDTSMTGASMVINSTSGNVGIGTTSPELSLDVVTAIQIQRTNSTPYLQLAYKGTGARTWSLNGQNTLFGIQDVTASGSPTRFAIDTSGNVGIGTTSPGTVLDIVSATAMVRVTSSTGTNRAAFVAQNTGGNYYLGAENSTGNGLVTTGGSAYALVLNTASANPIQFATTDSVRMTILAGGNVGIGTTAPTNMLHVSGNSTTSPAGVPAVWLHNANNIADTDGVVISSVNNGSDAEVLHVRTNNTTYANGTSLMLVRGDGNVGIGTTSPSYKLHVASTNGGGDVVALLGQNLGETSGTTVSFQLQTSGDTVNRIRARIVAGNTTDNDGYLGLFTRTGGTVSENVRILGNGNVGIGTTAPGAKLDVQDTDKTPLNLYQGGNLNIYTTDALAADKGGSISLGGVGTAGGFPYGWAAIKSGKDDAQASVINGYLSFYTSKSGTGSLERMRITSTGNVGIGTTAPGAVLDIGAVSNTTGLRVTGSATGGLALDVFENSSVTDKTITQFRDSDATRMIIKVGGNVGIGTTSPTGKLTISSTGTDTNAESNAKILLKDTSTTIPKIIRFQGNAGSSDLLIYEPTSVADIRIGKTNGTATTDIATFQVGGNVGIGTTAPGQKLEIAGNVQLSSSTPIIYLNGTETNAKNIALYESAGNFKIDYYGNSNLLTLNPGAGTAYLAGNVGIGTTVPADKLQISGGNFQLIGSTNLTDVTSKTFRIGTAHYTNNEEPLTMMMGYSSSAAGGELNIGGGTGLGNSFPIISFYTAANSTTLTGTERMRIDAGGNVGIGTTNPGAKLDVRGTAIIGNTGNTISTPSARLSGVGIYNADTNYYGTYGGLLLNADSAWTSSARRYLITNALSTNKFAIIRSTDSTTDPSLGTSGAVSSGTADFVIDNSGNVGIGTTSPEAKLSFEPTSGGAGDNTIIRFQNPSSTSDSAISVYNSASGSAPLLGSNLYMTSGGMARYNTGAASSGFSLGYDGTAYIYTGGTGATATAQMTVLNSGNVGIGTTAPSGKLTVDAPSAVINSVETAGALVLRSTTAYGIDVGPQMRFSGENGGAVTPYAFATIAGRKENATINNLAGYLQFNTTDAASTINERMRITSTGNVGIGTTAPTQNLHIATTGTAANVKFTNSATGSTVTDGLSVGLDNWDSSLGASIWNYDNGGIRFGTNNSERMTITSTGNVGIGTTAPGVKLGVAGNMNITDIHRTEDGFTNLNIITTDAYAVGKGGGVTFGGKASNGNSTYFAHVGGKYEASTYAGYLYFGTSATNGTLVEKMRITSTGNVGIGTTSPGAGLHVYGTDSTKSKIIIGRSADTSGPALELQENGVMTWRIKQDADGGDVSALQFENAAGGEVFTLLQAGNVGIGTTSPSYKLHVASTNGGGDVVALLGQNLGETSGTTVSFQLQTSGDTVNRIRARIVAGNTTDNDGYLGLFTRTGGTVSENVRILGNGNVGIGTTNPGYKLDVNGDAIRVQGTSGASSFQAADGTTALGALVAYGTAHANANQVWLKNYNASGPIILGAGNGNTAHIYVKNDGNVGIGTTSPWQKLDVGTSGNIRASRYYIYDGNSYISRNINNYLEIYTQATESLYLNTGNVGIGTTSPNGNLEISGTSSNGYARLVLSTNNSGTANSVISWRNNVNAVQAYIGSNYNVSDAGNLEFGTGGSGTKVIINSTGNVGIGTTAPGTKLSIYGAPVDANTGTIQVEDTTSYAINVGGVISLGGKYDSSGNYADYAMLKGRKEVATDGNYAGYLGFFTRPNGGSATEKVRINSDGNVGIGTTAPGAKLDVVGSSGTITKPSLSSNTVGIFDNNNAALVSILAAANNVAGLSFGDTNDQDAGYIRYDNSDDSMSLWAGTTRTIDIKNGNVGIGTTSPQSMLHLYQTGGPSITLQRAGSGTPAGQIYFNGENAGVVYGSMIKGYNGELQFFNDSTPNDTTNNLAQNVTITSTGNVGIGTTAPTGKLEITGSLKIPNNNAFSTYDSGGNNRMLLWMDTSNIVQLQAGGSGNQIAFSTGGANERMRIDSAGNVGIGTTNPLANLHLAAGTMQFGTSAGGNVDFTMQAAAASQPSIYFDSGSSHKMAIYRPSNSNDLRFYDYAGTAGDRVTIQSSSGNVGIGTTSPSAPLEVKGTGTGATIAKFTDVNTTGCTLATGGTISCSSDVRLKKNIEDINYGLTTLLSLRPVLYNWNYETDGSTKSLGFIAQEVESIIPKLVSTDTEGMKSLNTTGMVPVMVKAIQELDLKINEITLPISDENIFGKKFFDNIKDWLADAGNGISTMYADVFKAKEKICINDTCVTEDQLKTLLQNAGIQNSQTENNSSPVSTPSSNEEGAGSGNSSDTTTSTEDVEAPIITLNGEATISLNVGDTYTESGATVTDNVDTEIAIIISGNVDTNTPGTYTITYTATDTGGNSATMTRAVNVAENL